MGSIYILGCLHHLGLMQGKKDIQKAIHYYERGVTLKHLPSIMTLRNMYFGLLENAIVTKDKEHLRKKIEELNNLISSLTPTPTSIFMLQRYRHCQAHVSIGGTGQLTELYKHFVNNADENEPHGGPLYRMAKHIKLQPLLLMRTDDSLRFFPRRGRHKKKHTVEAIAK